MGNSLVGDGNVGVEIGRHGVGQAFELLFRASPPRDVVRRLRQEGVIENQKVDAAQVGLGLLGREILRTVATRKFICAMTTEKMSRYS